MVRITNIRAALAATVVGYTGALVLVIAASEREPSGIEEIDRTVSHMDRTTQPGASGIHSIVHA